MGTIVLIFLGALVIGLFWFMFFYKGQDESGKYRDMIGVAMVLNGFMGFGTLGMAFERPVSHLSFWVLIELSLLLFLIALALLFAIHIYERLERTEKDYEGREDGQNKGHWNR